MIQIRCANDPADAHVVVRRSASALRDGCLYVAGLSADRVIARTSAGRGYRYCAQASSIASSKSSERSRRWLRSPRSVAGKSARLTRVRMTPTDSGVDGEANRTCGRVGAVHDHPRRRNTLRDREIQFLDGRHVDTDTVPLHPAGHRAHPQDADRIADRGSPQCLSVHRGPAQRNGHVQTRIQRFHESRQRRRTSRRRNLRTPARQGRRPTRHAREWIHRDNSASWYWS
ncbi:MAG: hypothetical protein QOI25_1122 [Mycobacterium sp.]|nr:hypothetical protein [Mycobacterium sp.]